MVQASLEANQLGFDLTDSLLATIALFQGRWNEFDAPINDPGSGASNRIGKDSQKQFVEQGLSAVRERDEAFMRIRYTF